MSSAADRLRAITNFPALVAYLEDELDWPLQGYVYEDLTFEYQPHELGLKDEDAAQIKAIRQLRPLVHGQPWGIFFVEFDKKRMPVVVLRRILSHLVVKKRASANQAAKAAWDAKDLLFISAFGEEGTDGREVAFAHFHEESGDLPTLRVLGWDGGDTPLALDHAAATLKSQLQWPANVADHVAWRAKWGAAFRHKPGHTIRTANELAERMAGLARAIRDAAMTLMNHETEHGPLRRLHKAFQTALIHDLDEAGFADTYAQTIAYGLLTAAISRTDHDAGRYGTALIAENIADMVPITNPFLKEMLQTFLKVGGRKGGIDFDELGVQEVVELLRGDETDLPAILRDFGNRTRGEDPVIHFYEHFLSAYNKKIKVQRGVFYTPQPVVSYIVRSVHELLQTEFDLEDGLASIITWGEVASRHAALKIPDGVLPDSHFVQILDPATGTATFLVEVIDVVHKTITAKWDRKRLTEEQRRDAWDAYVTYHLLPRLYGYELMMAPYAIAHMKIGLKLLETGYRFRSDERVRVYLTNALEPPQDFSDRLAFYAPALAHEAVAVNEVKRRKRFTVVIGNPPYAGNSSNTGEWISSKVRDYYQVDGADLGERNSKWLQDDYVKFIRAGQFFCSLSPLSIFGFITNHGYIDNPTFRGMRQSILATFHQLWILDLHGNVKKKETTSDGGVDENVFDIQQGVAVVLASRGPSAAIGLKQFDIFGSRLEKYNLLDQNSIKKLKWRNVNSVGPFYIFLPQDEGIRVEYLRFMSIKQIIPVNVLGFQTHRDHFAIAFDREEIVSRFRTLRDLRFNDAELKVRFDIKDNRDWNIRDARHKLQKNPKWEDHIVRCSYRPFDTRWCYFSTVAMDYPRRELLNNVASKQNLCILVPRQVSFLPWQHAGVSDTVAESCLVSTKTKEQNYNFPLYLYPEGDRLTLAVGRRPNFSEQFLREISRLQKGSEQKSHCLTPEEILYYIYAVFHSPGYRSRYGEFLKVDFPRVPLTGDLELFDTLTLLGGELVRLHLLQSPMPASPVAKFFGDRNCQVEKVSWLRDTVWLDRAQASGFRNLPEKVWNFHIGGYQVCEKWLKDRKGRTLSADDIAHYQKIIVAISETIRLMGEIDAVIEEHGGWPGAFAVPAKAE